MRFFYSVIALVILAGCFYAGYKLGQRESAQTNEMASAPAVVPEPQPPVEAPEAAPPEPVESEAEEQARAAKEAQAAGEELNAMKARAAKSIVDLTDQQGRTIQAMILEPQADAIKVRRQVDFSVVEIPFDMLSERDQRFAEFLWKRDQAGSSASSRGNDEEISAERFDEIFRL